MACPICATPEGTAMTAGMRAGALVLIIASSIVIGLLVRFVYRIWTLERNA